MYLKIQYLPLFFLLLISCNSKPEKQEHFKPLTISKDSLTVPSFTIQLNLSDQAERKLQLENETVILDIEFIGTPKNRIHQDYKYEYYDENGRIKIGKKTFELKSERNIVIDSCKISKGLLDLIKDKAYFTTISVVSGRKSSENNLLDCEFVMKNIETIKNQTILINGKLIGE
ncbi:hypothetical protein NAT51_19085 [Flavobacterium amniphilum]|uniref:hypothetical protein n=1 Tax=Flavobacterium amniphilum TaxID=1834035 RepID=UPI002029D53A|nr:hypothetical protein [Flavobacterium amniphilum]MCL9807635.1 hypothetical protein [Flavobacterium amniphilum]